MLGPPITTVKTLYNYALQSQLQQLGVVDVGPGHHHAQRPAVPVNQDASTRTLRLLPILPRSVGLRPTESPKTRLAHGAVCRLPFPVHAAQFLALLDQHRPDTFQHTKLHPALEGPDSELFSIKCALQPIRCDVSLCCGCFHSLLVP